MGAHGWLAEIVSHGSVMLSWSRLVTVNAPRYPSHTSSIQHYTIVKVTDFAQS